MFEWERPPGVDLERTGCGDASACLYVLRTPLTPSGCPVKYQDACRTEVL
jgi:hypothetical protein